MSEAWNPTRSLSAPWDGGFKPAPGIAIAPHLRLVRPVIGASAANVWVVDQLVLQIEVALKFAAPEPASEAPAPAGGAPAQALSRFLRQARCAARIADPHLVQILEQGTAKNVPFMVTELLEGKSLRERLLSGPLSLPEAQAVLTQCAGVLAKAHPLGLCHGSVCPEHLFLTEAAGELFLKIANFGDLPAESASGESAGSGSSAAYLSPEQLSPEQPSPEQPSHAAASGAAADIWALGVTLYELLTTTLPFEAPTPEALQVAVCSAQFAPPSHYRADVSPALDAWFARVLAKDPAARLLDPTELAREFGRALSGDVGRGGADPARGLRPAEERMLSEVGDEDADERTVRWDLPEWSPASAELGAFAPESEALRPSAGPSVPPPLPDRRPSSRPPPALPEDDPSPLLPSLAELARTTEPSMRFLPTRATPRVSKAHGLIAGALLGGVVAVLAWGLQSWSEGGDTETGSAETRTGPLETADPTLRSNADNPARPRTRPSESAENLPRILQTDDLPQAPEESAEEEQSDREAADGRVAEAGSTAARKEAHPAAAAANSNISIGAKSDPRASAPKLAAPKADASRLNARLDPGAASAGSRVSAAASAAKVPARRSTKHSSVSASCNPPYYFDNNNIRRLKLECL